MKSLSTRALLALLVVAVHVLQADFISSQTIEKYGINYRRLQPVNFSETGDYFVACEPIADIALKAQGITKVLRILHFQNNKLSHIDSIPLPVVHIVNISVNDKKDQVMVLANYGNKILLVDTKKLKIRTVFKYQRKKPGFKAGPLLICRRGKFYANGWFYDSNQIWRGDYLVRFKIRKKKPVRFIKKINEPKLFPKKGMPVRYRSYAGERAFYAVMHIAQRTTYLMSYYKRKLAIIDKGYALGRCTGTVERVYYAMRYKPRDPMRYFIKDLESGKTWKIGKDDGNYSYPFLSAYAETLVVAVIDMPSKTLKAFYGKAENNYRLKPFLDKHPLGPMKLSANGRVYLVMSKEGIQIGTLP